MKIHYNYHVYLLQEEESKHLQEFGSFIFSGSLEKAKSFVARNSSVVYLGLWREGTLSQDGERRLLEEGVSLDSMKNGVMQAEWIYNYIEPDAGSETAVKNRT
jgi:hypothetical protein